MGKRKRQVVALGPVHLGDQFVFNAAEILGEDFAGPKPPYDGQVLRVIGFKPRYVNQVEVRDAQGRRGLLPLDMVEKALRLEGKLSDENSSIPEVQFCNDWCCAQSWSMPIR